MAFSPDSRARLLKVLNVMSSATMDGEVLAAALRAKALVEIFQESWDSLLRQADASAEEAGSYEEDGAKFKSEPYTESRGRAASGGFTHRGRQVDPDVDKWLEELFDAESDFIADLREQWEEKGWISPKQRAALYKWYENSRR